MSNKHGRRSLRGMVLSLAALLVFATTRAVSASGSIDFNREVRPILNNRCSACHGGVKKSAGFSVNSRRLLLAPTENYGKPVMIPGNADHSELIRRISTDDPDERMPPEGEPLKPGEIELIRRWIDAGAVWPDHWAYVPLEARLGNHSSSAIDTAVHPIDRFTRKRLSERGIKPSPTAERATIIRRLSLDLTGLLPTPQEVEAFVNDSSLDAYKQLANRLLSSPHFGERWARHWLDEARYADSEGYEKDTLKQDAFRYRDWVIQVINEDLPFDQFTIKQIAGDLLPDCTSDDLIATKFHLQTQFNLEGGVDSEEDRTRRVIDRINTVGTVWMGMTIGCCQCHDHPYDPFDSRDFYSLYAFFNNADFAADFLSSLPKDAEKLRQERKQKWASLSAILLRQTTDKNLSNQVQAALSGLRHYDNSKGFVRYLQERQEDGRPTYMFARGDFLRPMKDDGEIIPNTPHLLPPLVSRGKKPDRLDSAMWLVRPDHPLTARVTVNKVWMHLFGKPLASQPGDFGSRGAVPSHPELLDWLAYWFIHEAKWSRKSLIRLVVNSETYRQSSVVRPELSVIDPDNKLLARQNRFRVEAEILRDIALQASGLLSHKIGGPSVFPPLPAIVAQQTYSGSFKYSASQGEDRYRRGLYTFFRRTAIDPNLSSFDCLDSSVSKSTRYRSNNALQALTMLQNEVYHEAAQAFAKRLLQLNVHSKTTDRNRFEEAFHIALGRLPRSDELTPLEDLLNQARIYFRDLPKAASQLVGDHSAKGVDVFENAAWIATVRVILNLDEFITRN